MLKVSIHKKNKNCQFATNYNNADKYDASENLGKTIHYIINLHILHIIYVLDRKR